MALGEGLSTTTLVVEAEVVGGGTEGRLAPEPRRDEGAYSISTLLRFGDEFKELVPFSARFSVGLRFRGRPKDEGSAPDDIAFALPFLERVGVVAF